MTDKQIIIDGVDVSGCNHYKNNGKCRIPHYQQNIKYTCCNCSEWNCYYKQLKRKEQECEKYSKALEYFLDETGIECDDEEQAIRTFTSCGISFRRMQQYNNNYEQALESIEHICRNVLDDDYIRNLAFALLDIISKATNNKSTDKITNREKRYEKQQLDRYKQTLTKIKEIAENMNEECFYDDFDCINCDMQNGCTYFNKKQILQKISECEVNNDR